MILFSLRGRLSRSTFWLFQFLFLAIVWAGYLVDLALWGQAYLVSAALLLAAIWPVIATAVKRCHDRGLSGRRCLIYLVPVAGQLWWLVTVGVRAGAVSPAEFWRKAWDRLGPLMALSIVYGLFASMAHQMISLAAVESMVIQTVIVGTAAVGMTMVIISGGIDLSAGSMIAFSSVVGAYALVKLGVPAFPAVCLAVMAGAFCGLCNGLIITLAGVVPFIVTLGMLLVVRGSAKGLAESAPINIDNEWITSFVRTLAPGERWKLLPPGGWMMILLAATFWAMMRYTRLGRHTYAIGSNEQTARLCGVNLWWTKLRIYMLSGACAGLSGVMLLSRQRQGDPTGAFGYELDVIAAVVIGGGSLAGGEGSIFGSLVGALIMTVIRTGCNLRGLPPWITQVVTGAIIVIAVALDRLRHRRAT